VKNPTQKQIALLAAAVVAIISLAMGFAYFGFKDHLPEWISLLLFPALVFVASYLTTLFFVEKFIYRKIKLIYKIIHNQKPGNKLFRDHMESTDNILDDVQQEVRAYTRTQAREIEQLKEMEKYRKEFLGNVSHELKTPIFNVQGYLDTLISGGLDDPKINMDFLYKAAHNADRLSSIVEDLLLITQYEDGALNLDIQKFNIGDMILEQMESLEMQADNKDITLEMKQNMPKNLMVKADPKLIPQVLNNLIGNSIKYGKEGGKTLIGIYDMDENVLVEITDNGPGIEAEHLPRLFERFYRVDKSRSRMEGGNGLGLAIVKHIIEAHGQTVNVRSTIGVGSTFGFTLRKA
jgi:two-component system phosphate regulon sensor histidine kinase PhoR